MTEVALRPRSATELIDAAVQLYRQNFKQFITLSVVLLIPFLALGLALTLAGIMQPGLPPVFGPLFFVAALLGGLWYVVASSVFQIAVSERYLGREIDMGAAFRAAMGRLPALILGGIGKAVLTFIAFLFIIVPGIYVGLALFAVGPVILFEGRSAGDAIGRSWDLSRGLKGKIFLTWLIVIVLVIVVSMVFGLASVPLTLAHLTSVGQVVSMIGNVLMYPFMWIVSVLLYYDARIQKEGMDIELMSQSIGAPQRAGAL